jgi:beta-glucosidase
MSELSRKNFGSEFRLGVATSSYQIEGAVSEDGRGPSIWDRFSHTPGKTKHGHTGDVACDHYHRMPEDVALLDWMGVDAYRFSIAWPRVLPKGRGAVNEQGLDFYDRLVDALLDKGIAPCATLYHWDLPDALEGGWLARDVVSAFGDYASVVSRRLGDRVALWLTHNEPWCMAFLGYETGLFAPGRRDFGEALSCAHHLLVSHGLAVQAIRANARTPVGAALNFMPVHTVSKSDADLRAARRLDGYMNRWFADPVFGRGYPSDLVEHYGELMPHFPASDISLIAQPIDVLGINYYERGFAAHDDAAGVLRVRRPPANEFPRTLDREIYPQGLGEIMRRLHDDYQPKAMVITENGAAFADEVAPDGIVHDAGRVEFLREHLLEVQKARQAGLPVEGYFAWSLMDNFEWSEGYTLRYGIVHVDFDTQKRTPKDSARFLRSLSRRPLE